MKDLSRDALLIQLHELLTDRGSWCGETHLQKSAYLAQNAAAVPLDYDYVLYKHGPYSFRLHDVLTSMRAKGLLRQQAQPYPYGPSLVATDKARRLLSLQPNVLSTYRIQLESVADFVGARGVSALERLTTALYYLKRRPNDSNPKLAAAIHEVKPHVSEEQALAALEEVCQFLDTAKVATSPS